MLRNKGLVVFGRPIECNNLHGYDYIEKLFNKPLNDFRKFCIWRIFVPYFINVKRLPRSDIEAFDSTKSWLDRCNIVERLNFDAKGKMDYALDPCRWFLSHTSRQIRAGK